jgi:diguanylate cyclase
MSEPAPSSAAGDPLRAAALAAQLEELMGALAQLPRETKDPAKRETIAALPEALRHVSLSLRGMADAIDAGRGDLLVRRQRELTSLISGVAGSVREVGEAGQRVDAELDHGAREVETLSQDTPSPALAGRLRDTAARMEQATKELGDCLSATAAQADSASKRAADFEQQVAPAAGPAAPGRRAQRLSREALDKRLAFAVATGPFRQPWCLLVADIDNVEELSERYSVSACDMLLDRIARMVGLRVHAKCPDASLADFSDTAYAAVVPGEPSVALDLAEQVRQGVASVTWAVTTEKGKADLSTTASIVVAPYRRGDTVETLTERAQKALDDARREGPDRVVTAEN